MKKSFFKKLSFVLALAMIVSTIAPAASAFAAATPKLSTTATKYLTLGQTNEYDFNVANKAAGAKYAFTSSDKKVATVDSKNGVTTAKAVGTTTIKLTATLKNGKKYTSSCKVVVKDNFKTLVIAGAPVDGKLVVNAENTFSTTGTTYGGAAASKTAVVAFAVTDGDGKATTGATITDAGVFKATVPGTYKVTANAFQSAAKYTDWKTTGKGATATVSTTVTVVNAIKNVTAVKSNALKVTFEAAVTAVDKANFTLANKATSAKVVIKSVDLDTTKTFATVTTYDSLVSGQTYTLTAKVDGTDMSGEIAFVQGTPKTITVATTQIIPANVATPIKYTILDENGLDITDSVKPYFEDSYSGITYVNSYYLGDGQIAYATVCYINPTTGAIIKSDKVTIKGSNVAASEFTSYTIQKDSGAKNFDKPVTSIKKDVPGTYTVWVKAKDQYGNALTTSNNGDVTFESLDPSIFVIDAKSGVVTPLSVGVGSFRITYGGVATIKTLEIKAAPVRASLVIDKSTINVSSTGLDGSNATDLTLNNGTLKFAIKDQYGDDYYLSSTLSVKVISDIASGSAFAKLGTTPLDKTVTALPISSGTGYTIAPTGTGTTGTVSLQVTGYNFAQIVTINVVKADNTRVGYVIDGAKALDIQQAYDGDNNTGDFKTTLAIYSVNAAGYKVQQVTDGEIELKAPDTTAVTAASITFDTTGSTAQTASLAGKTGTFTVTAKRNGYTLTAPVTIAVSDTGVKPAITAKSNVLTGSITTGTGTIKAILDGMSGTQSVYGYKYYTGNTNIVTANPTIQTGSTAIGHDGTVTSTSLYQFTVQIKDSSITKDTGVTVDRIWEYNFGTITAKES